MLSGNGTLIVFLKLYSGEGFVSCWERRLIICNRGSIADTLSGLGRVGSGSLDSPRALRLASDGRGFSYDSGDEVSDVSGKWTPLDLTSEEISGGEVLVCSGGCIGWRAVAVIAEANEKGE